MFATRDGNLVNIDKKAGLVLSIFAVAPLAGAWIEISRNSFRISTILVAPLAGAWIEIIPLTSTGFVRRVAPLAGAWIEMVLKVLSA